MSWQIEAFKSLLKQNGQSVTRARLTVFKALLGQEPMGMTSLAGRTEDIDRASVYRAVELFERLGIVQRLNTGWKYKLELSDKFNDHHHHLACFMAFLTSGRSRGICPSPCWASCFWACSRAPVTTLL